MGNYQFAARTIQHRFCKHCGIKVFGKGIDREGNPFYAVSLTTLDDLPASRLAELPIHHFNGRHDDYEHPPNDTSLL